MVKSRTYLGEARHGEFVNPDAHPAIVSRVDWEAANGVRPVTVAHSKTMAPALLGGLVRCGGCRYVMPRSAPRKDGGHPRYLCSGRHARGICENRTRVSTALIEPHVETLFVKWLQREGITATGQPTADNDAETATRDLEAAELELAEYRDDTLVSVIGREAYRTGLEKRAQTVEEARERLLATQGAGDFGAVERRRLGEAWPDAGRGEAGDPYRRHRCGVRPPGSVRQPRRPCPCRLAG